MCCDVLLLAADWHDGPQSHRPALQLHTQEGCIAGKLVCCDSPGEAEVRHAVHTLRQRCYTASHC
jgi:hypothetical protein